MAERAFLDAVSGPPLHPAARQALDAALDRAWADPGRGYHEGRESRVLLDAARASVAGILGVLPDSVAFTASGTAAMRSGVRGALTARSRASRRLVAGAVEHSGILRAADEHATGGGIVEIVEVDSFGRVDAARMIAACVAPEPAALACLQAGNHEVGTLQPVAEVAEGIGPVPLLLDAGQALGRADVPDGWSILTASARAWGGPPGVGILAVRPGVRWDPPGALHERERGRAPEFSGAALAIAAAAALEAVERDRRAEAARVARLVDRIRRTVPDTVADVVVLGDPTVRLPHIVTFSCLYADGEALVGELDAAGVAVGSGSACVSDTRRPSHVLAAMGAITHGNLRVSLPIGCPDADVDRLLAVLPGAVARVRAAVDS